MKILAIDYGERRIGLAISDESENIASPLTILTRKSDEEIAEQILKTAVTLKVEKIVIGLPVRTDVGTKKIDSDMELKVKSFAEKLRLHTKLPVVFFDERFTTRIAEQVLLEADLSCQKRKRLRDKLSAAVLLQSFLEWQKQAKKVGK